MITERERGVPATLAEQLGLGSRDVCEVDMATKAALGRGAAPGA